jgi:hypothetical protein
MQHWKGVHINIHSTTGWSIRTNVYASKKCTQRVTMMINTVMVGTMLEFHEQPRCSTFLKVMRKKICKIADLHPQWPHMSSPAANDTVGP